MEGITPTSVMQTDYGTDPAQGSTPSPHPQELQSAPFEGNNGPGNTGYPMQQQQYHNQQQYHQQQQQHQQQQHQQQQHQQYQQQQYQQPQYQQQQQPQQQQPQQQQLQSQPPHQAYQDAYNNGYSNMAIGEQRPQTSYSDTGNFSRNYSPVNPDYAMGTPTFAHAPADADMTGRQGFAAPQPAQPGRAMPRPSSSLGGAMQQDRHDPVSRASPSFHEQNQRAAYSQPENVTKNASVVIKVGMVGDAQIGKTSLMVKYVEGSWDEDYIQTLGVNFMEKTISIRNTEITFSIWDLGGQREFVNMLPLVCNDAVAILFMFDLTRKSTLNSIKEWYRQSRGFNKTAIPFLVGTKYDHFVNFPREEQEEISNQAKRFAKAMKASLIFSSTSHSINVQKIFKIVLSKAFDLRCTIPEIEHIGEPLLLYNAVG